MSARRAGVGVGILLALGVAFAAPASAATTTSWAAWQPLAGSAGAYTSSVAVAATPDIGATVTSDSRGGQVGVISGSSTWLSEGTPVGAKYGSSKDRSYLNLRPKADNATSPSTTTYSFAAPTPTSGWTFVLGDIDADAVRVQAVAPDGHVLDAAELGFRGGFNYCGPGVAGKPSCTGDDTDVPTWDASTLTLTGNAAAADTSGASAWFEPSTPIRSLTFEFTRRAGFPVYQTWFASLARDVTGQVADQVDGPLAGATLTLTDYNGVVVATTTSGADGSYSFPGLVATDGYTVSVSAPDGKIAVSPVTQAADLTTADAVVDFEVREIIPVPVSGRVTDRSGAPVAGVTVTVGGQTAVTGADGRYLFDQVGEGDYTATITTPDGYTIISSPPPFTVPEGVETPITGVDFQLAAKPSVSGTVGAAGSGVAGILVTAVGPAGTLTTVTAADGSYSFPGLDAGDYTVSIQTPTGFVPVGATSRDETVADADVTDVDFELARLGAVEGTVSGDGGAPVAGVTVTVAGPGGSVVATTDADGVYSLGGLAPGTYVLTVTPPTGSSVVGAATRTVIVTAAGEVFTDQDFALAAEVTPPTGPGTTSPSTGGGTLPATGLAPETFVWAGVGLGALVLGGVLLFVRRRAERRRGDRR